MKQSKKNAFTLIELIATLVIMAIIALIVTPLVMSIIRKARVSADKRSIDAYGRSIELAIAGYLLDNGKFPTEVSQLTIEYSENKVECETTQINSDSSVYLAGCTVAGRSVDYTYGADKNPIVYDAYEVGDEVTYNNVNYYVIEDSSASEDSVTLLKAEPLTVAEVNRYGGVGTEHNHVNMYVTSDASSSYYQQADDYNKEGKVGGMAYYSSTTCGYNGSNWVYTGCTTDYTSSEVKYVVDAWKTEQAPAASEARLITLDDLTNNLGIELNRTDPTRYQITVTEDTPTWVMGENYWYWTMTTNSDKTDEIWYVHILSFATLTSADVRYIGGLYLACSAVRPVIVLPKSALN